MSEESISVNDLENTSEATNYRNWMFNRFRPYLGQRIFDAGAGIGTFTELLLDREFVVAADGYAPFVDELRERLGDRLPVDPVLVDLSGPGVREFAPLQFDTVLCVNVLEHIKDDCAALANFHALLQPGGRLVLFVPAHQFLFGTVDRQLEHYRRYSRREVRSKFEEAGFAVEHLSEMNLVGMAGWFLNNRVQRRKRVSSQQIMFYDRWVAPWAERMESVVPPPIGLSVLAVGRKD